MPIATQIAWAMTIVSTLAAVPKTTDLINSAKSLGVTFIRVRFLGRQTWLAFFWSIVVCVISRVASWTGKVKKNCVFGTCANIDINFHF